MKKLWVSNCRGRFIGPLVMPIMKFSKRNRERLVVLSAAEGPALSEAQRPSRLRSGLRLARE